MEKTEIVVRTAVGCATRQWVLMCLHVYTYTCVLIYMRASVHI